MNISLVNKNWIMPMLLGKYEYNMIIQSGYTIIKNVL